MTNYINRLTATRNLVKVPEITLFFWVIKILTTAMGEATSDYLVHRFAPAVGALFSLIALIIALKLQFNVKSYTPWRYWLCVSMVSVFGTMAADGLHVELGIPYIYSASFYLLVLAAIFILWYKSEKTLSIHSINSVQRECFYWATVIATFALGTATGDLTATSLKLGYFSSGLLFAAIFVLPAIGFLVFKLNSIFCFWFAYILTRPLGASFADWFGVPKSLGGLNYGRATVSLSLSAIIIVLVVFLQIKHSSSRSSPSRT